MWFYSGGLKAQEVISARISASRGSNLENGGRSTGYGPRVDFVKMQRAVGSKARDYELDFLATNFLERRGTVGN